MPVIWSEVLGEFEAWPKVRDITLGRVSLKPNVGSFGWEPKCGEPHEANLLHPRTVHFCWINPRGINPICGKMDTDTLHDAHTT